jgi:hypothetical protein
VSIWKISLSIVFLIVAFGLVIVSAAPGLFR